MQKEKKKLKVWIKEHKKELIISGVSIASIGMLIIGVKNYKDQEKVYRSLEKLVEKTPDSFPTTNAVPLKDSIPMGIIEIKPESTNRVSHDVSKHIRNLPEGYKPSMEKVLSAADFGFELLPGQTWVKPYKTGMAA